MNRDLGLGQLVEELEQRGGRLPFEIGAFVALEACEGLLQQSVKLEPDDVRVTIEGAVVVSDSAPPVAPQEASRALMSVLARLLVAAGPGVPPDLLELVKERDAPRGLRDLHDAIEASLIPINRSASRRVLARLVRESDRPPAPEVAAVDARALDADLDELLRDTGSRTVETALASTPPTPEEDEAVTERLRIPSAVRGDAGAAVAADTDERGASGSVVADDLAPTEPELPVPHVSGGTQAAAARRPREAQVPEPVTATIRKWAPAEEPRAEASVESTPAPEPAPEAERGSAQELPAPVLSQTPAAAPPSVSAPVAPEASASAYDRPSVAEQPPRRRGGWGIWLFAAALGLGAYAAIATGQLDAWLEPAPSVVEAPPRGIIDLTVTPSDAQIFIYVGRGPATAARLPVDSAHEFVVFDRGLRPARASVPREASWDSGGSGPLYELAVQTRPVESPSDASDLGMPETEPSNTETTGDLGTVRVITNPRGAKVYRFVGLGPTARIRVLSIHEGQEVLVYRPGYETRRAVIGPSDWQQSEDELHRASLAVQLPPVAESAVAEPVEN